MLGCPSIYILVLCFPSYIWHTELHFEHMFAQVIHHLYALDIAVCLIEVYQFCAGTNPGTFSGLIQTLMLC